MNRRNFLQSTATSATLTALPLQGATAKTPNIVVILADDFGFGSLNCNGADPKLIRTPNLDRIAKEGVHFTDANTPSSVCTPSRYALMTGRYCWRTPLQYEVLSTNAPLHIETTRLTLASLLKGEGYSTAAIGKWHLGYGTGKTDFTAELKPGPLEIGFDYHFGVPQNHGDASGVFVENHGVQGLRSKEVKPFGKSPYGREWMGIDAPQRVDDDVMEVLTDHAADWIGKQRVRKPFFLFFTPVAVHEPVTPSARAKGSSAAGPYGDWVHDLDHSVGRVLKALDEHKFARDTLLVFTSDNGGVFMPTGGRSPGTRTTDSVAASEWGEFLDLWGPQTGLCAQKPSPIGPGFASTATGEGGSTVFIRADSVSRSCCAGRERLRRAPSATRPSTWWTWSLRLPPWWESHCQQPTARRRTATMSCPRFWARS